MCALRCARRPLITVMCVVMRARRPLITSAVTIHGPDSGDKKEDSVQSKGKQGITTLYNNDA